MRLSAEHVSLLHPPFGQAGAGVISTLPARPDPEPGSAEGQEDRGRHVRDLRRHLPRKALGTEQR